MKETVAVIGLGRVGLPLALCFAEAGLRAYGIDISANLIDLLKKKMHFLEEGAAELLEKHR